VTEKHQSRRSSRLFSPTVVEVPVIIRRLSRIPFLPHSRYINQRYFRKSYSMNCVVVDGYISAVYCVIALVYILIDVHDLD